MTIWIRAIAILLAATAAGAGLSETERDEAQRLDRLLDGRGLMRINDVRKLSQEQRVILLHYYQERRESERRYTGSTFMFLDLKLAMMDMTLAIN